MNSLKHQRERIFNYPQNHLKSHNNISSPSPSSTRLINKTKKFGRVGSRIGRISQVPITPTLSIFDRGIPFQTSGLSIGDGDTAVYGHSQICLAHLLLERKTSLSLTFPDLFLLIGTIGDHMGGQRISEYL